MRKLTAGLFHAVDGVVEAPGQWQFEPLAGAAGHAHEAAGPEHMSLQASQAKRRFDSVFT